MHNRLSRRHFFYGSMLAGAVPVGGFSGTLSASAAGYKSCNEKLNVAFVGVGTRGPAILQGVAATESVALCDVGETALNKCAQQYPKAAKYKDFRQMLDKEGKNIDVVMIATPDHSMRQAHYSACSTGNTSTAKSR